MVLLVVGALVMWAGAETAVRGSMWLARAAGVQAFVLGALLFGVDLEGLGAAVVAAGRGQTEIAGGEVFGTVLFLFTAAFGVALLLSRRPIPSPSALMLAAPALGVVAAALTVADRLVTRAEGLILVALYGAYVFLTLREGRPSPGRVSEAGEAGEAEGDEHLETEAGEDGEAEAGGGEEDPADDAVADGRGAREAGEAPPAGGRRWLAPALVSVGGLGVLYVGALLLVAGGTRVVDETGLVAGFVGAAVIGALASLDEVLLEVLPVRRGVPELATGNLLGTLAAFTTGVLGLAALVRPLRLDGAVTLTFLAVALLYAVVATTFFARKRAGWGLGVFVLAFWALWLALASRV